MILQYHPQLTKVASHLVKGIDETIVALGVLSFGTIQVRM